ncbi:cytochrome c class I [Leadbetterella byssophila DSM 17132]|uniref:Cytochrome c class I n=1 Tax=Leadbetterella byssophila (strain DSM 17132 / JCM 16389 / KACC 11308 / NBRC 106382 / 4M15) TaxID=649349 RepID=E4RTL7_LEAB4|nr:ThuA domain-containing protein [Leadbetterella byssophila]ADQ16874.1 cytochrome c class I [Leadbetterella byssophila DSM 17132]
MKRLLTLILVAFTLSCNQAPKIKLLVFSKTEGFRHDSIEPGIEAIKKMAQEKGFEADFTEDASTFLKLEPYTAVVFLNTTGDVLNDKEQEAFERYIQAGGGYVGIHAATDTEYDWPWYGELAGAYFLDHPSVPSNVQKGKFTVVNHDHESTKGMPEHFEHTDEFYNFRNLSKNITPLMTIDETSYEGGKNPDFHPMSWYQEFDGGRSFYTALGHTKESFSDPMFLDHLWGGIQYATAKKKLDYSKSRPEENRFTKVVLAERLDEPMELSVLDEERVMFIQRKGEIKLFNIKTGELKELAKLPVSTKYTSKTGEQREAEDGLLGLSKDPNFAKNHWIYLYYSHPEKSANVLARYEMKGDDILFETRKELLEIPVQREECCHTGGSITWDKDGNLYLSTGDNTNPHGSNGYSPSDERPGRESWDAQRSSANTNDLRGKILRIKPQDDGTYTIPEGNLFPKGTPNTRPEIYTMGHRNPFRISVDQRNGYLYWGDVGPDARDPKDDRGPAGHDEVGQAKKAGNFGWPHFVGDNKAYNKYDFEKEVSGPKWDAEKPINTSPNNTGLKELPPAQKAFIWYPYGNSPDFPIMGNGGRNAMAGPVYYKDDFKNAERRFPDYYDKKVFVYEWMRGFILSVTLDENGDLKRMEKFLPNTPFNNPMDMEFAPNGDLYMLEYGTGWFVQNDNARLIRIEYNGGNRKPIVHATSDKTGGALPLEVNLSAEGSEDLDGDDLTYHWKVTNDKTYSKEFDTKDVKLNINEPGLYKAVLTVNDGKGGTNSKTLEIVAGNALPEVHLDLKGHNSSFFKSGETISYDVKVKDKEDGELGSGIDPSQVSFSIDFLAQGFDKVSIAQGHKTSDDAMIALNRGKNLIADSDCKSCHDVSKKSVGPTYTDVAKKYEKKRDAVQYLSQKIINGGSGAWGEIAMAAHPNLPKKDAEEMAKYILSLGQTKSALPLSGKYTLSTPKEDAGQGTYILRASYYDKGANGLPSLNSDHTLVLRNALLDIHAFDEEKDVTKMSFNNMKLVMPQKSGAFLSLKNVDLNGVKAVTLFVLAPEAQVNAVGGKVELRLGSPNGTTVGESPMVKTSPALNMNPEILNIPIHLTSEQLAKNQDLYLVFKNPTIQDKTLMVVLRAELQW